MNIHFGLLNVRTAQSLSSSDDMNNEIDDQNDRGELVPLRQAGRQVKCRGEWELRRVVLHAVNDARYKNV